MARRRGYLQEREITWREARERHIWRGTLIRPGKPRPKPLEQLHVRISPTHVYVPRWPVMEDGSLRETPDMIRLMDLPTAIRQQVHKLEGERSANRRMLRIRHAVEMIHARVVDHWNSMTAEEKEEVWRHLEQIRTALRGRRRISDLDARDRKKAVERLERLLDRRRPGEIAATLVGVANDLTARRNVLLPQMRFTERMRKALIERKTHLDETAFRLLDEVIAHRTRLRREGIPRAGPIKRELLTRLRQLISTLDNRPEPELRENAARHVREAVDALRGRRPDIQRAIGSLRRGARAILASNARYTWLYPSRLDQVAQSQSRRFKEMIAERQLRLFRDNLEYWHSPKSHEPLSARDIGELLRRIGQLVPGTRLHHAAESAAELLRRRQIREAKQILMQALEAEER